MKKVRTTLISLFLIFAVSSSALANGLSLNSVGTRALGMGGFSYLLEPGRFD